MRKSIISAIVAIALVVFVACEQPSAIVPSYTVTYDYGYDGIADEVISGQTTVVRPEDPVREGYAFLYWEKDGQRFDDWDMELSADVTLTAVWSEKGTVYVKETNKTYDSFSAAVEAVSADNKENTLILLKNTEESGFKVVEGQNITVDLNGYKYTINSTVGSTGTETNGFQLLKGSKVYFKNGEIYQNLKAIVFQNYADLTLENVSVSAMDDVDYILSNNNGSLVLKGKTNITAPEGKVAFDVYYWPSNGYVDGVVVTIDETFTGSIDGKIEYASDGSQDDYADKIKIYIKGGTFENFSISTSLENAAISISGGSFDAEPDRNYIGENCIVREVGGRYIVEYESASI